MKFEKNKIKISNVSPTFGLSEIRFATVQRKEQIVPNLKKFHLWPNLVQVKHNHFPTTPSPAPPVPLPSQLPVSDPTPTGYTRSHVPFLPPEQFNNYIYIAFNRLLTYSLIHPLHRVTLRVQTPDTREISAIRFFPRNRSEPSGKTQTT